MYTRVLVFATLLAAFVLPGCESAPSKTVRLTSSNFEDKVLKSKKLVLVDFWAEWCAPCKAMDPVIKSIASEFEGKFVIGQVNVDDDPGIAEQYGISGIPTFLVFKDGVLKHRITGSVPRQTLTDVLLAMQ